MLLIMQFVPYDCHVNFLRPKSESTAGTDWAVHPELARGTVKCSPQHFVLKLLQFCYTLSMTDQVPYP
jgi:hypothetical protein